MRTLNRQAKPTLFILSAERFDRSKEDNKSLTDELKHDLITEGYRFKQVEGNYLGNKEVSFLVNIDMKVIPNHLVSKYDQDCGLLIDINRECYINGDHVGKLTVVDRFEALCAESYTFDPVSGGYFIIK